MEVRRTKFVEQPDTQIDTAPAGAQMLGAKLIPVAGMAPIEPLMANAADAFYFGGGTASGDGAEGFPAAQPQAQIEGVRGC